MAKKMKVGCAVPTAKEEKIERIEVVEVIEKNKGKEVYNMVKIGKVAPSFTTGAYHNGDFINVNLEDYRGKWVVLCFYPGDFTFV